MNERLNPIIAQLEEVGNPTLAFLASGWEGIKVRLTAKGADSKQAHAVLDEWQAQVLDLVGDVVFGFDADNMETVVLNLLREQGLTLGLAESVTGGLVSGRLTAIPGASDVLRGSVVSYSSEVKFDLLDVPRGPVVSEDAAVAMAEGARRVLGSDVALSLTGVAGPAEQDGQPVGTLCIAGAINGRSTVSTTLRMPGQRDQMRQMSVISSLDFLRKILSVR